MDIQLRLLGGPAPDGEPRAHDAARLLGALHELSIRLGRHHAETERPGRSHRSVEELCEVRLAALTGGGTTLLLSVGPPDVLPLEGEECRWYAEELLRVLHGLAADERPERVPDLVADAVADLVQVLRLSAREVEIRVGARQVPRFRTVRLHRETWTTPRRRVDEDVACFTGTLERVDLPGHELRLRDEDGTVLELLHVVRPLAAAALLGRRAEASGRAVRDRTGRLVGLDAPTLSASTAPAPPPPAAAVPNGPGAPDPAGQEELQLTDEEIEAFLRSMGR
ncbi:hypothetical protein [Desertihabitans brevis]|nr:hypothetical protein [Desertihabitans brevis]